MGKSDNTHTNQIQELIKKHKSLLYSIKSIKNYLEGFIIDDLDEDTITFMITSKGNLSILLEEEEKIYQQLEEIIFKRKWR